MKTTPSLMIYISYIISEFVRSLYGNYKMFHKGVDNFIRVLPEDGFVICISLDNVKFHYLPYRIRLYNLPKAMIYIFKCIRKGCFQHILTEN